MAKPYLPNLQPLIEAGIDPKTGLPLKMMQGQGSELKGTLKQALRIMDEQAFVRKYKWNGLPESIDPMILERIMYYRGQGMFFHMKEDDTFYFLPFALNGTIDVYGRYRDVTPVPFNGTAASKEDKPWIIGLNRKVEYMTLDQEKEGSNDIDDKCVILRDYTQQLSQHVLPRSGLQEGIIDFESDILPFMRTALMAGTGITGMRCDGADQAESVKDAARSIYNAALKGEYWIPIEDISLKLEELTQGTTTNPQDYLLALQSVDNLRLSFHGLDNGGLYEKKQHITNQELSVNSSPVQLIYQDGLESRQRFCDLINSHFGLNVTCEMPEEIMETADNTPMGDESEDSNGGNNDSDV